MSENKTGYSKELYIAAGLLVASLIAGGVCLIIQSNQAYNRSLYYTDQLMKDPAGRARLLLTPSYTVIKDGYAQSLLYFTLALGVILLVILLPRLQMVNISGSGINIALKDLPQKIDAIAMQANAIQANSTGTGGKQNRLNTDNNSAALLERTGDQNEDPQKGRWGGEPIKNHRRLYAVVTHSIIPGLFKVKLVVESTDPDFPLTGLIKFHLHNTFENPNPVITVIKGTAVLVLPNVYGAFTVGAEADEGRTQLELDLAGLKLGEAFTDFLKN